MRSTTWRTFSPHSVTGGGGKISSGGNIEDQFFSKRHTEDCASFQQNIVTQVGGGAGRRSVTLEPAAAAG